MDVLVLIDKLDDLVHNAKAVPLTDQVRIDREEIYDILDQMRATIPEEIKQARWIVKERQEMLAEAKRECDRILGEAREQAVREASQTEIVKLAERQAQDIVDDARRQARETRLEMEDWADSILSTLEVNLDKFLAAVRRGRERLHERSQESRRRGRRRRRREHERRLPSLGADSVDTYLAVASKRDWRSYADRPVPEDVQRRILDAGRVSGQLDERPAVAVRGRRERRGQAADRRASSTRPRTSRSCAFAVAIATEGGRYPLDVGRALQNMFLVAWNEGVVSCPNGIKDRGGRGRRARPRRGLAAGEHPELRLPEAPARPGVEERRRSGARRRIASRWTS